MAHDQVSSLVCAGCHFILSVTLKAGELLHGHEVKMHILL